MMARMPKISLWWCIVVGLPVLLMLALNPGSSVPLASVFQLGGVTVIDLAGTSLPRLAKDAEADLVTTAFPFAPISIPDGILTLQGRLTQLEGGTLPSELDIIVKYADSTTLLLTSTFPLAVDQFGAIPPKRFSIPQHTIDAGHQIVVAFMPRGSNLPLSKLDILVQFGLAVPPPSFPPSFLRPLFPPFTRP